MASSISRSCMAIVTALFVLSACNNQTSSTSNIDRRIDSVLNVMTIEEKAGQLTLYTSDMSVTGPTIRPNYLEDIKGGRVGALFNAFGAAATRRIQEIAVKETRLHIPLLFGFDVIHGHK